MTGRPSEFTQEKADAICERLADGESLRSICLAEEMPARSTVFQWLGAHPEFSDQYARAREAQGHACADMATDEAMSATDPQIGRLRFDAMKWKAAKLVPKSYSDKVTQEHTGANGGPIQTSVTVEFV